MKNVTKTALTCLLLLFLSVELHAGGMIKPPVFDTQFAHWDHHWFVWLPSHPVYESVEVMERTRGDAGEPLVWVFFTERAGGKEQVHYFNYKASADAFGENAYFAEMNYQRSGAQGLAQSLSVMLEDTLDGPVEIYVESNNSPLWPGGLTNQSGHAIERLFLIFFREKSALAIENRITINGEDFSFNSDEGLSYPLPFKAAYSANLFTGIISYSDLDYSWCWRQLIGENGDVFSAKKDQRGVYVSEPDPFGSHKEYQWHGKRLLSFTHFLGEHKMAFEFEEGINFKRQMSQSTFSISLDDFDGLITGEAKLERKSWKSWQLQLSPLIPEWASQTTLIFDIEIDWHGYRIISSHQSAL